MITSYNQAMSDGTMLPSGSLEGPVQRDARLAEEAGRHSEIEAYIAAMLGPDLAGYFKDAYPKSVSTGCYDHEWRQGGPYLRIEKYVHSLRDVFMRAQGEVDHLTVACLRIKAFGTDKEREALKKLLQVEHL